MDFNDVDEKTAFKMGFAAYCADHNLSKEAAEDLIKEGFGGLSRLVGPALKRLAGKPGTWQRFFYKVPGRVVDGGATAVKKVWPGRLAAAGLGLGGYAVWDAAKNLAPPMTALGVGLPIAASLAAGGGLGWGAAKLNEPSTTPEDIQAQELKNTYEQYTKRLKARRAYQQYRDARGAA